MCQTTGPVTVGLLQHRTCPTAEAAWERVGVMAQEARQRGARLVVTPELFTTPYFPRTEDPGHFDHAEPIPGPTTEAMGRLARKLEIHLSASIFERRASGVYHNSTALLGPDGKILAVYRKMHIPDDPAFYEKFYFTPGDAGSECWRVAPIGGLKIGLLICWDQWFPEAARLNALRGAELLLYPTAIAWDRGEPEAEQLRQRDAWRVVQRAHAIANGVYVAAVNRVGDEGGLTFWGGSFIAGPGGEVLAEAASDREEVLVAHCDPARIEEVRRMWPFFRDRRLDAYGGLMHRWST
ncbi:MAG: carbon-nitrogen hydrolase [Phycisphaeraceae bacterium]|nr:carbon-nitrogen hydrolase [Phycisphaeraceae bacterium]